MNKKTKLPKEAEEMTQAETDFNIKNIQNDVEHDAETKQINHYNEQK